MAQSPAEEWQLPAEPEPARRLAERLEALWRWAYGQPITDVTTDLTLTREFFDSRRSERSVRDAVEALGPPPESDAPPPALLAYDAGAGRRIPTPEARLAIELLADRITEPRAMALLAAHYRAQSRHRIERVTELLLGTGKPLQLPAVGAGIVLLINRCDARSRWLPVAAADARQAAADRLIALPSAAFAEVMRPSARRNASRARLDGGWWTPELTRRLPRAILREDGLVGLAPSERGRVIDRLALELARRKRIDATRLTAGLAALADQLRADAGPLRAHRLYHESPKVTRATFDQLEASFKEAKLNQPS